MIVFTPAATVSLIAHIKLELYRVENISHLCKKKNIQGANFFLQLAKANSAKILLLW